LLVFIGNVLAHILLGQTDGLAAVLPNLLGILAISDGIALFILKDLSAGAAGSSRLAILGPSANTLGAAVPAPVNSRLGAFRIIDALSKTLSGLLLSNVATSDVLHEPRECLTEPRALLTEQSGLGNTARVHAGEGDAGLIVVPTVKLRNSHHIADLIGNITNSK